MEVIGPAIGGILLSLLLLACIALRVSIIDRLRAADPELWQQLGSPRVFPFMAANTADSSEFERSLLHDRGTVHLPEYLRTPAVWYRRVSRLTIALAIIGGAITVLQMVRAGVPH